MSAVAEPPASVGSAVPSSAGEIKASSMTATVPAPATPPLKPVTPMITVTDDGRKPSEKMFESLRSLAKDSSEARSIDTKRQQKTETKPAVPEAKTAPTDVPEGEEGVDPTEAAETAEPAEEPTKPAVSEKPVDKKKTNPWKLIDEHKKARATLEAEVADLKKITSNPELRKQEIERLAAFEKRNQELEEHIKFVDYSKSTEFLDKYQKPYEAAWTRAMSELKELTVTDPQTGDARAMSPADLLELVNMPLLKAREQSDELYGAASNEVMAYRKEIKGLYEQQAAALKNAREAGTEKHSKDTAQRQAQMETIRADTAKHWEEYNKSILDNETTGHYFKPVEGNEEINKRLDAGYKFVDETMALNPLNPSLTTEQRQEAIKRHASLRARAAAFGRMRHDLESARKELEAVKKKLGEFEETVPGVGGDGRENGAATLPSGGRMAGLMQELRKKAK